MEQAQPLARSRQGFTLIELMVVVVIIGILAALAIPRFSMAAHQSKEKEADLTLKQVYTLQQTYYANNGTFASDVTQLQTVGFDAPVGFKYYSWSGDVSLPLCLPSTGPWAGRRVDLNGKITDC
ncbi:MAG TPA: prepilin-type N-terminal cleavage/methylation domain-containing protein [Longimicrobium sp.]|nr:prepilin-type N-terminal cleavage/methylation domain-containing protein [Longimicrobium sp.]